MRADWIAQVFLKSAVALLIATAAGKLLAVSAEIELLHRPAPLVPLLSVRSFLLLAALGELCVAVVIVRALDRPLAAGRWLFCLALLFTSYRLGLWVVGFPGYCGCLGSLADIFHLAEDQANFAAEAIIAYFLVGSYIVTGIVTWERKRAPQ